MHILKQAMRIDFIAGAGAFGWAVAAQYVEPLSNIVSWEAAAAFGLAAFGRFYVTVQRSESTEG